MCRVQKGRAFAGPTGALISRIFIKLYLRATRNEGEKKDAPPPSLSLSLSLSSRDFACVEFAANRGRRERNGQFDKCDLGTWAFHSSAWKFYDTCPVSVTNHRVNARSWLPRISEYICLKAFREVRRVCMLIA